MAAVGFIAGIGSAISACSGAQPPAEAPPAQTATADMLVLNNFTLIDGRGGPPAANSSMIVTDGRISWVGPSAADEGACRARRCRISRANSSCPG